MRLSLALLLAATACSPAAPTPRPASARPDPARIVRRLTPGIRMLGRADTAYALEDRMRAYHVPGVSIAVIDDFRVVWARGFGVTEFGGATAVDTTTLFQAGSISKPVFATGALALVQQGRLALDDDVNGALHSWHVPDTPYTRDAKVTLRRLLTHSAGLTVWGFPGYEAGAPMPTVVQVLNGAPPANTIPVRNDTVPGARWLYSGGGFTIAQLLATDVTGEPFPSLMRRLVLDPMDMPHSAYEQPLPPDVARHAASGHERIDTPVPGRFHVYPEMAAAGLWTTASDLARWAIGLSRALGGRDGGPLSPATARMMLSPQVPVPTQFGPAGQQWGLGVALDGAGDSLRFSHGGRDEGFVATFVMYPIRGRGLVVLTNGVSGALLNQITRAWDAEYGLHTLRRVEQPVVRLERRTLDRLAGRYTLAGDTVLAVTREDDHLRLRVGDGEAVPVYAASATEFFRVDDGSRLVFEHDTAGAPTAVVLRQGQRSRRAARA